jgi:hypothetical protein
MKKLNFMNAKNTLDRDEMKKIMAGSSIGGGGCHSSSDCGLCETCEIHGTTGNCVPSGNCG